MKKLDKLLSITTAVAVLSTITMTVSAEESLFTQLDANADGKISATEARAHKALSENFATVDANSDGYVTKDELSAAGIS